MVRRILPGRLPQFPDPADTKIDADGFAFIGGSLNPVTLLEAYRKGLFPWDWRKPYPWYSPDPRLIVRPERFRASDSLRKLVRQRKLTVRYDTDLTGVIHGCATVPRREGAGTWITSHLHLVYGKLFDAGIGHSVEVYDETGMLVGGLWGLAVGKVFFGESMFARAPNASKVGFYDLCVRLATAGYRLVDCQADTPHLRSLGGEFVPRFDYIAEVEAAWVEPDGWAAAMASEGATGREPPRRGA